MRQLILRTCALAALFMLGTFRTDCQNELPEVFRTGTIPEQLKYLDERTRIYENYRAIREDMYRTFSRNTLDSLTRSEGRITDLLAQTTLLSTRIDSLKASLETTTQELAARTRTKNSIRVIGIEVNKTTYNTVMWTLLAALVFLLAVGYLTFKHNRAVTLSTRKELAELKAEFEAYRTKTRLEREKTAIDHFNEMKRMKGKG